MTLLRLLLCLLVMSASPTLLAACNTYSGNANLGSASSLNVRTTAQQAVAGAGLSCDGLIQALAASYIRVTLLSSDIALRDGNGNSIALQAYTSPGYTQSLSTGAPTVLGPVNLIALGGSSSAVPLYFRTQTGANVPAGTYTATISLRWDWAICTTGALNVCVWQRSPGVTQPCVVVCGAPTNWGSGSITNITLTLQVTKACLINSLPNVDFGSQALVSQFQPVTQSLSVTCTITEGYTLGFGPGLHYLAPTRRLQSGGSYLRYYLYKPASDVVWDTLQTVSAIGSGNPQSFSYRAAIDPTQANVPAGNYTDTVLLIINY